MPRGIVPRQPARTGRQDKVKNARVSRSRAGKDNRADAHVGPGRGKASAAAPAGRQKAATKPQLAGKIKGYNPVAPERVAEILKRLDQLYPDVHCALTHASAWELLVATIHLSSSRP